MSKVSFNVFIPMNMLTAKAMKAISRSVKTSFNSWKNSSVISCGSSHICSANLTAKASLVSSLA